MTKPAAATLASWGVKACHRGNRQDALGTHAAGIVLSSGKRGSLDSVLMTRMRYSFHIPRCISVIILIDVSRNKVELALAIEPRNAARYCNIQLSPRPTEKGKWGLPGKVIL